MTTPDRGDGGASADELLQMVSEQVVALARKEVELARQELTAKARLAAPGAAMLAGGGLLGLPSAGTATADLVLMLARRPRPWVAALTVTGLYAGGGAARLAREPNGCAPPARRCRSRRWRASRRTSVGSGGASAGRRRRQGAAP